MGVHFTDDGEADRVVNGSAFAFLVAMILDQQIPMEWAFAGPKTLGDRLDAPISPDSIAALDLEELRAVSAEVPAVHRYHRSMAERIHKLATFLVDEHDGDAEAVWRDQTDAMAVKRRLKALPGFGDEKAKITLAALVKRYDHTFEHWERAAAPFSDDEPRSIADVASPEALAEVRAWKKRQTDAGLGKQDPPAPR